MPRPHPLLLPLIVGLLVVSACSGDDEATFAPTANESPSTPSVQPSPTESSDPSPSISPSPEPAGPVEPVDVETIATGLGVPWDIEFLPDGAALVSERETGRIVKVTVDGEVSELGVVDSVAPLGEGGLLGLALRSDWLYAYYTGANENVVVRMPFDGSSLAMDSAEVVFDGIPKGSNHDGGRIIFGPDDMLYVATGETGDGGLAQSLDSVAGSILRITPEGDVPDDGLNPFDGSPIWSYGHRNVEGLAFDDDGRLWASEFGQDTWDELNLIEPGENYGWPEVEGIGNRDEFVDPVAQWTTAEASPSGIAYVNDTLFMAALRGQRLWQIPVVDGVVGSPADFYVGEFGRLRHVELAPDGTLWALTNNTDGRNPDGPGPDDDRVLRITLE
jgi:glucose/arabinose dehydrogenase